MGTTKQWGFPGALGLLIAVACLVMGTGPHPVGPPETWEGRPPHHAYRVAPEGKQIAGSTSYYEPQQVRHAYGFDQLSNDGTGQIIGIVDAYDAPSVASDLQTFITNFGLQGMHGLPGTGTCTVTGGPHPCFQKVYAQGVKPKTDGGWALEISLDVQWAHAMAPGADILLVEASNASFSYLMSAVDVAVSTGATVVSMSWGGSEFASESSYDFHFAKAGVTFTAASGDSGTGLLYPAVSPYVLAVGGTTLPLDLSGTLTAPETAWSGSGGGISAYEAEPGYQASLAIPSTGGKRGSPDVSYSADPSHGFLVYDSTPYHGGTGWWAVGGTSAGAPQWAALTALANQTRATSLSSSNLAPEYNAAPFGAYYRDITAGSNGNCAICTATPGYDFVTGLGSPKADTLVPYLITSP